MATSLLRIGRLGSLKALQLESWGGVLRWPAAALCTQGGEPPANPGKAQSKKAAAAPEPEEPFDNSTYKNCQHHNYNTFTFVDLDLEMAKHRLPQPSSGRPSPLH
ncbi:NADH dehydrogenase [ubiquinone] flavoprotein 3, mitochondrial isoform X2 [Gadus macrocephalus]|uniref:NADH dehydrogenase [ubiquinone] flavoprotein 3, mitochondrial n=1 Tax=Gadus morhua TaxID=8049 RepID=A0A8C5FD93_GADMO|nr:NADH dehydrogenase [ubiquinone] flavoprotein 3, mitochondrial isoform X2 [Gadus chalcogrammus]XP_059896871.1 NADH dehydrogenase [ubiquinone] flavoprotein 3, mitochondrial isoform X2 [Gadus macrocephalus]